MSSNMELVLFRKATKEEAQAKQIQLIQAGYSKTRITHDRDGYWEVRANPAPEKTPAGDYYKRRDAIAAKKHGV